MERFRFSFALLSTLVAVTSLCGCADRSALATKYDFYYPSTRQLPPEEVYSRVTYSHLPAPIPLRSKKNAPLFPVVISFELPNSNLEEAVEALAQTIGYRWEYPKGVARKRVSVKMAAPIEEVLGEICRQAGVQGQIDYEGRVVRVFGSEVSPELSSAKPGTPDQRARGSRGR